MTKQADFKNKIRARMEKTGERYAAARHALLRQADASPSALPTVPAYTFRRGYERDHSLLTSALAQAGVTDPASGEAFTETRLFGPSGGIGFMSFLFEYAGHAPMLTFVCRSWSMTSCPRSSDFCWLDGFFAACSRALVRRSTAFTRSTSRR